MSALSLVPPRAQAHLAAADDDPTCTLWWVRLQLGRGDVSDARFTRYVQGLVDSQGFPPPLPSMPKGRGLTRAVTSISRFRRDAVLAWLDHFLPPSCAATLDAQALAQAATEMDAAAQGLGGRARLRAVDGARA